MLKMVYFMPHEFMRGNLTGDVPKKDHVIHAGWGDILAGRMQVDWHDRFLVAFKGSDQAGVLIVMHVNVIQIIKELSDTLYIKLFRILN